MRNQTGANASKPGDVRSAMMIQGTEIADTFAEAFSMSASRVTITAADVHWLKAACQAVTGYACSVIACDAEAGVERILESSETPDGRVGAHVLFFGFSTDGLQKAVANRVGQCVMTCPTTACFDGLPGTEKRVAVGSQLRFFGDGWQISKLLGNRRFWRIPVMDGEFLCEESVGVLKGVAGGNFMIMAVDQTTALSAVRRAVEAIDEIPDVIMPFPGGVVRSGSKVGSKKYSKMKASTNDAFCPTLRTTCQTELPDGANCAYEIVIDGLSVDAVSRAMKVGILAACGQGVLGISAGNYGGKLGKHHLKLYDTLK
jgi:formylmethanofuran--tetrahydromethanopterin N-formyltransferase